MDTTQSIVSIGVAASYLQAMPDKIHKAADELGIRPVMKINQVDHFSESDLQRIANHLRGRSSGNQDGGFPRVTC